MKIKVNNFAQIKSTDFIEIRDFTVLIGNNGSGKTYFAKLVYFINNFKYNIDIFRKNFEENIKKTFENKEDFHFLISDQKFFINEVRNNLKKKLPTYLGTKKDFFKGFDFEIDTNNLQNIDIPFPKEIDEYKDYLTYIWIEALNETLLSTRSTYLPAARANYMITYKYLFESQYNSLRSALLSKNDITLDDMILPEVENTFLQDIYNVKTKHHGFLYSLGTKIEKEVLTNGKLSIKNPNHQDLPTYEYKLKNVENQFLDLVAASSAVTELSPLIMYLRHQIMIKDHELLIIDEPELSLHPEAQQNLVSILIEAVNSGLKLVLVTHSPFIIEALNNHLQRAKIDHLKLPANIKKLPAIDPDKVATYLFEENTIKDIFDRDIKLVDDKLLSSFNRINDVYNVMRDIEWDNIENQEND